MTDVQESGGYKQLFKGIEIEKNKLMLRLWQSGRELFHSNMLAFLLEHETYGRRLLHYLWCGCNNTACNEPGEFHVRALREHSNMDLFVLLLPKLKAEECTSAGDVAPEDKHYWDCWRTEQNKREHWNLLVIENKFKSLPDPCQLERYKNKVFDGKQKPQRSLEWLRSHLLPDELHGEEIGTAPEKDTRIVEEPRFVILVPSTPSRIPSELPREWKCRTWKDIASVLKPSESSSKQDRVGSTMSPCRDVELQFTARYAELLHNACDLQDKLTKELEATAFAEFDRWREYAARLRLHDFVDKWRYEWLADAVRGKLHPVDAICKKVSRSEEAIRAYKLRECSDEGRPIFATVSAFFSRGTGGVNITLHERGNTDLAVEVQLQANDLKIMISQKETADKDPNRRRALELIKKIHELVELPPLPDELRPQDLKKYDQYVSWLNTGKAKEDKNVPLLERDTKKGCALYYPLPMWSAGPDGSWQATPMAGIAKELARITRTIAQNWDCLNKMWRDMTSNSAAAKTI